MEGVILFRIRSLIGIGALLLGLPAVAQDRQRQGTTFAGGDSEDDEQLDVPQQKLRTSFEANQAGRTADSLAGQVGQRQTRDIEADRVGSKPMARVASRIQNRVQNRIRNRVDRNYDPQANATDPFAVAEDQSRKSGRPR